MAPINTQLFLRARYLFLSLACLIQASTLFAQSIPSEPPVSGELEIIHVQGNVWLIAGAGGNIAVQAAEQGCLSLILAPMDLVKKSFLR